jgi:7,8-dihydropterin-6-yl-methyl-4-(beta-D-ribofuranosyl)aminobenzene 5'-phosphate synthase
MTVTVTTLVENTSGAPFIHGEWGQSLLIETDENTILFDTGPGDLIMENATRLGVDLRKIDKIVLSHGHYDHTGGLQAVLVNLLESGARPDGIEVVAHPHVFQDKFIYIKDMASHPIGIPFAREDLEGLGARFNLSTKPVQLNSFTTTTGEVEVSTDHEKIDAMLHIKADDSYLPDKLADDLGIIIKTEKGLILLLGCAHRGIINTINHARKITGIDKVYAVIGGTHLIHASDEQLDATVAALKEMKIEKLGTSHCTGLRSAAVLASEFKDIFFFNNAGTKTVF